MAALNEVRPRAWELVQAMAGAGQTNVSVPALTELRRLLSDLPADQASVLIQGILDSGQDAALGLPFRVGPGGYLTQPSTLRVFLLDYLGQIDPAAAAAIAQTVLDTKGSPDEWAVSLRNLARATPGPPTSDLLRTKLREMWSHLPWRQSPAAGYLEAFDVAVYLGGTNLVPDLTGLMASQDNPAVARAAYLAVDRLLQRDPAPVLEWLLAGFDQLAARPLTRADYFARADVRDPIQQSLLERYLLDPRLSEAELRQFEGRYPSANFMVSDNLLTQTPTPLGADLVARDRQALVVLDQWLTDARFAGREPVLTRIRERLSRFLEQ